MTPEAETALPEDALTMDAVDQALSEQAPGARPVTDDELATARLRHENMVADISGRMNEHAGDDELLVEFFRSPMDSQVYVSIQSPGDLTTHAIFMADKRYRTRFRRHWEAFERDENQLGGQQRLDDYPWISVEMCQHLGKFGIRTVEALAGISDSNLDTLGPGSRAMRERARVVLAEKSEAAPHEQTMEALNAMMAEMAKLRAEITQLKAEKEEAPAKRGPGRPRKDETEAA